jgi:hypothetical protein
MKDAETNTCAHFHLFPFIICQNNNTIMVVAAVSRRQKFDYRFSQNFSNAFAKLRKATISFVMSFRPHGSQPPLNGF